MIRFKRSAFSIVAALCATWLARAASPNEAPEFKEICDLLRTNLPGVTEEDCNRAAVDGLLAQYRGKVALEAAQAKSSGGESEAPLVTKAAVIEGDVAYLRVQRVADGLSAAVASDYHQLSATNRLKGIVLDLRFARGEDYAAAAATADLFLSKAIRLLDWGQGIAESKEKTNAISLPLAVLVNKETSGAPEALAAAMREAGAGLILGSATAGDAVILRDFPLSNGQRLRIGAARVRLGDGSLVGTNGLQPDIQIPVTAEAERVYYANAYALLSNSNETQGVGNATNRAPHRSRLTEADLVRERREGGGPDDEFGAGGAETPEKPLLRDPALARGVDLLKGLAVVRQSRF